MFGSLIYSNISSNSSELMFSETESSLNETILGVLCGIMAAACWASAIILIRKLNKASVHYSVSSIYTSFFAIPITLAIWTSLLLVDSTNKINKWSSYLEDTSLLAWQIGYTLIGAVFGIFQIIIFNQALLYKETPQIAMIQPCDLVFGFVLQYLFLGINPDLFSYLGAGLIMFGVFLVILLNYIKYLRQKSAKK